MRTKHAVTGFLILMLLPLQEACAPQSDSFSVFVDEYLDGFARRHPSIAAGNGIHDHDGLLDDFSADAVEREIAELKADRERLGAFDPDDLTPDERVDQRILDGIIDGWLLEQETLQNWRRNPMLYAAALSDGVHNLMAMEYAPASTRMERVISKLADVPKLLDAARTNIVNPPSIFAERGASMMRGASGMLGHDLPLAFESEAGTPLMDSLVAAAAAARPLIDEYAAWLDVRRDHPRRGELVDATQRIVDSLTAFVISRDLAEVPEGERVIVAPAQPFDLGFASMHASPPLEATPVKSFFYITDANADWPLEQQDAWLERYNYATLANTAVHEAMPGHWLHAVYMRRTPGKVRRIWICLNPFPQPSSGQDGWAHYTEQLMVDEGYGGGDPRYRLAQQSDALTRICRLISGIRVHTGEWSMADAQRCFEEEAYLATPAAEREAERAAYDPTYGGYFLGKRGVLALREDYAAKMSDSFDLREFHERIMSNGIAPIWAHRQLMLPGDTGSVIR